ncbi:MAG: rhomboid family intramembrane serine protease [Candidatus Neomarinimicrobiota bacterium]|nr:rhomboid family intramembrane serine protease [Candidatus Neomarinimicrobiota bacterium]|tara:strand:+ start:4028 stop:4678 length:651 start_codon:yes stop_codon:yes gene_type:complete
MLFPYKDDNPRILVPYVTYVIISINVLIFVFQLNMGMVSSAAEREFIYRFGFIPANFSIITVFTSMFLHGGISHIMGNMWFLWVFGDNVEGVLGHVKFAVFYIICGLAATMSQLFVDPSSTIPMVGASGAIAGVLGMYMIRFPHARVHVFAFIIIFFTTFRIPAMFVLGFWFFNQLTNGLGSLGFDTTGGVAWFAHIGGFISGVMLNQAFKHIRLE